MRLGVISDTHGHVELTRPAVRMLESLEVEAVLHCGDIGSMAVVELFAAWPTHFVFGNCDENTAAFAAAIKRAGQTCHGLFGELDFDGVKVVLLHSHERNRFRETIDSGRYRLVCYGHTHVAAIDRPAQRWCSIRRDLSSESAQHRGGRSARGRGIDHRAVT